MKRPLTIRKAIIPAAGAGSRMGYLGSILPKCMYPLADKPIIHRVVDNARLLGVEEFVIVTHFKEKLIHEYFEKHLIPELGIRATFIHQEKLSGLADAIALGQDHIREPFAVILGDDFTLATDFDNLLDTLHRHTDAVVVEGVVRETNRQHLTETCCVERDASGRMLGIVEKPAEPSSDCRGTGFYLFRPEVFDFIQKTPVTPVRNEREITETIRIMAEAGRAYAEFIRGINMNINSFDDLLQAWNTFSRLQTFLGAFHAGNGG
ncbi:MAG: nucleotidyltransferase family protein [Kiritimatiellae bacterium]|nr:nucleotidyltransferase family protein [Kiritimatiellia bacterium]